MDWRRHRILVTAGTVVLTAIVVLDWGMDIHSLNLAGWQAHAQSYPPARGPTPTGSNQPAPTAPATSNAPVRTETIVYNSWAVTCTDTLEKGAKKTCSATLQVIEEKQRQVVMVWIIGRDNQGVLRTVIQSPTGVQIPKGVELKLGAAAARTMPYIACNPQQCEASIAMDDAMIRDARASSEALATIVAADGRSIWFKMDTKGIDKAFAAFGK